MVFAVLYYIASQPSSSGRHIAKITQSRALYNIFVFFNQKRVAIRGAGRVAAASADRALVVFDDYVLLNPYACYWGTPIHKDHE